MAIASELLAELAGGGRQADAAIGQALREFIPSIQKAKTERLNQQRMQQEMDLEQRKIDRQNQIGNIISTSFDGGQFSYKNAASNLRRAGYGEEGDKVEDQGVQVDKAEYERRKAFSKLTTDDLDRGIKITAAIGSAFSPVMLAPDDQVDQLFNIAVQKSQEFLSPEQLEAIKNAKTPKQKKDLSQGMLMFGAKAGEDLSYAAREHKLAFDKTQHTSTLAKERAPSMDQSRAKVVNKYIDARAKGLDPAFVLNDAEQLLLGDTLGPGMGPDVALKMFEGMPDGWMTLMKNDLPGALKLYNKTVDSVTNVLTDEQAKRLKFGEGNVTDTQLRASGITRTELNELMSRKGITNESLALRALLERQRRLRAQGAK